MIEKSPQSLDRQGFLRNRDRLERGVNLSPLRIHDKNNATRKANNPKVRLLR
jgi:hypothetical protein